MYDPAMTELNTQFPVFNSGSVRYNMYEGDVVTDDLYTIMPFVNEFMVFPQVPGHCLYYTLSALNAKGYDAVRTLYDGAPMPYNPLYEMDIEEDATLQSTQLPKYIAIYTGWDIDFSAYYDLIVTDYDSIAWNSMFTDIYPPGEDNEYDWTAINYPTDENSLTCLTRYIKEDMPTLGDEGIFLDQSSQEGAYSLSTQSAGDTALYILSVVVGLLSVACVAWVLMSMKGSEELKKTQPAVHQTELLN
ncbi:hypothetical protein KIPB_003994 [Kipferlia bialata]|uniref:Putative 5'-nucleotidase C-terminal domain-containing protein n=1 Tax=Kipferlia bialata TaxID=797122 RepID=A0A9K3CUZ5_9EUKA|nr:hypothetical protein KIPB_003994 [Kipferlia bialata]|eukprot:g3994.t1